MARIPSDLGLIHLTACRQVSNRDAGCHKFATSWAPSAGHPYRGRMASITREQAQAIAAQWVDDVSNGVDADMTFSVYGAVDNDDDRLLIGRYLAEPITEAIDKYLAGDRSPAVVRLVAVARQMRP